MTQQELIKRLETTCFGLDPIDPLRLLVDDVIAALAQPEQKPVGFAGIEMWIGNTRIKKLMTQTELHFAIDPWAIVKFNSDSCIDALKEMQS